MDEKHHLTVALTVDADFISDSIRREDPPVKVSHGEFGARVGMPRLLESFARHGIPSTLFAPGHSMETWPELFRQAVGDGHELAVHGWYHEDFAELGVDEQRGILDRAIETIGSLSGAPPAGFRAPYWSLGPRTLEVVRDAGFRYDSSLMSDDFALQRVRIGDVHSVTAPTRWGEEVDLVEVPVYWALDDWPFFEPGNGRDGLSAPSRVLEVWTAELRYAYERAPGALVTLTVHPECIGRGHRMAMLERFVAEVQALDGVRFERLDRVVERWRASSSATQS